MSTDTSKSPDKGSEAFDPHKVERFFAQTGIPEFDEDTCVSSSDYDAVLALLLQKESARFSVALDEKRGKLDLTPSKEDYKIAWQMQHPNAMGANWPGIPGNPYPPLADLLCCKRMLEEARTKAAEFERKGEELCNAHGTALIRIGDLERDQIMKVREMGLLPTPKGWVNARAETAIAERDAYKMLMEEARAALATAEEAGVRKALAIAGAPDFPRAPEGTLQNAFNAGLREYHTRILALLSGEGTDAL